VNFLDRFWKTFKY